MSIKLKIALTDVSDRSDLTKFFDQMKLKLVPFQAYNVYFVDDKALRSIPLNKYYWGVVVKHLSDHTGYTGEEMHEYLKMEFLPKEMTIGGITKVYGGSTASLTNQEFIQFFESVRLWAAETLDVIIPLPNEVPWQDIVEGSLDTQ